MPYSCSCSVTPWVHSSVPASLKKGRTVEHALGSLLCSCFSKEGAEHALGSVLRSCGASLKRRQNWRTCSGVSAVSVLASLKRGRIVEHALGTGVLSGMGSLQCVPALVMYPDCGPVWHGQSSVCASPSHVPRLWSCLAWALFSVCQP